MTCRDKQGWISISVCCVHVSVFKSSYCGSSTTFVYLGSLAIISIIIILLPMKPNINDCPWHACSSSAGYALASHNSCIMHEASERCNNSPVFARSNMTTAEDGARSYKSRGRCSFSSCASYRLQTLQLNLRPQSIAQCTSSRLTPMAVVATVQF